MAQGYGSKIIKHGWQRSIAEQWSPDDRAKMENCKSPPVKGDSSKHPIELLFPYSTPAVLPWCSHTPKAIDHMVSCLCCFEHGMITSCMSSIISVPFNLSEHPIVCPLHLSFRFPLKECRTGAPGQVKLAQRCRKSHYKPPYHARMHTSRIPCGQHP
jgi:hypothetical protein